MAENRTTDWPLSPEALLERVREIALDAGRGVEAVKERARGTAEQKEDGSPVTVADRRAHEIIVAGLRPLTPDLPVVSEEARPGHESNDARFWWLVDPLDGTKAFIAGSDDYTVNIALVDSDQPVLGVIYAPASDALYEAVPGHAARRPGTGQEEALHPGELKPPLTAAVSRSHASHEAEELLRELGVERVVRRGSSLKMCAVAAGEADLYPRLNPTCYWDTAAGTAVARAAGCRVEDPSGRPLRYDRARGIKHHGFIVRHPAITVPSETREKH